MRLLSTILLGELVDDTGSFVLWLVPAGGLVALVLSGVDLVVPARSRTRFIRFLHAALGVVLVIGAAWIVLYAMGPDSYFQGTSGISRWEFAARDGKTPLVGAAIATAAVTSVALLASALAPGRARLQLLVAPAAALSCFLLLMAWFFLTVGH